MLDMHVCVRHAQQRANILNTFGKIKNVKGDINQWNNAIRVLFWEMHIVSIQSMLPKNFMPVVHIDDVDVAKWLRVRRGNFHVVRSEIE